MQIVVNYLDIFLTTMRNKANLYRIVVLPEFKHYDLHLPPYRTLITMVFKEVNDEYLLEKLMKRLNLYVRDWRYSIYPSRENDLRDKLEILHERVDKLNFRYIPNKIYGSSIFCYD